MRVGTKKFQRSHGFRRGTAVYWAGGGYAKATTTTGADGVVGSIMSLDQFELVTMGEIEGVDTLTVLGDGLSLYLTTTPGDLSTTQPEGAQAVAVIQGNNVVVLGRSATQTMENPGDVGGGTSGWSSRTPAPTVFRAAGDPGQSTAAMAREDHSHPLVLNDVLNQLADATPAGIAIALAETHDAQEALLGIPLLRTSINRYMTLAAVLTGDRTYTFPDQDGTVAVLEREQTFTFRQHVLGDDPVSVLDGEVSIGGGSIWASDRIEIGTRVAAAASRFQGADPGASVLAAAGEVLIGGGYQAVGSGILVNGGRSVYDYWGAPFGGAYAYKPVSVLMQPRTAWGEGGLNIGWMNPPAPYGNGRMIAHIGIATDGSVMDFSADGVTGGWQIYTNTGNAAEPPIAASSQQCANFNRVVTIQCPQFSPSSPASNTTQMGKGSIWAYNWVACTLLGVGVGGSPLGNYYADFDHGTKWARFSGAVPTEIAGASSVLVGGGTVNAGTSVIVGAVGIPTRLSTLTSESLRIADEFGVYSTLDNEYLTFSGTAYIRTLGSSLLYLSPTTQTIVEGTTPTSSGSSSRVAIGGGSIWTGSDVTIGEAGRGVVNAWSMWGSTGSEVGDGCRIYLDDDIWFANSSGTALGGWNHTLQEWSFQRRHGFPDRTTSTISFKVSDRTFTVAPTGTSFYVWRNGKAVANTAKTVTIPNATGFYFIYLDSSDVLNASLTAWSILDMGSIPVATVYWNASDSSYAMNDERHGSSRNLPWHYWAHKTIGTRYETGLAGTFTDTTLSVATGVIHDEDIDFTVTGPVTTCRLWRYSAVQGAMRYTTESTPYLVSGGTLQYDNAGSAASVSVGSYVINDVYATTDPVLAIYIRVGTAQYATLSDAQAALSTSPASWAGLSLQELKLLYRVIYRNLGGTPTYISATDFRTSSSVPGGGTASVAPHASTHNPSTGSDPLTFLGYFATGTDAANLTGTVADARLSANVALNSTMSIGLRNRIINGCFRKWDYATTQTTSGYGSANNWKCEHNGSTKTVSQQAFTAGQTDVPGEPQFFKRTVVTSSAGAGNYVVDSQRIESVRTFAGKNVTVSFYAKADAARTMALELSQCFGTGGSPSANVTGIGAQKFSLTTSWQKFTATIAVPSISGKTLGTTDDGYISVAHWFDAGSSLNSRTASLGQQSGTFDIARVRICEGSVDCDNDPDVTLEILDTQCARFLPSFLSNGSAASMLGAGLCYNTTSAYLLLYFKVKARVSPTGVSISDAGHVTLYKADSTGVAGTGIAFSAASADSGQIQVTGASGLVAGNATTAYLNNASAKILFTGCEL